MPRFALPTWKTKSLIPLVLMLIGAALLAYVGVEYGTMFHEQDRLTQEWQQQQNAASAPATTPGEHEVALTEGLTKVSIPKIKLDAIVVEGTGRKQLLLGPGHMIDTPAPGEVGNAVISGHRDTFFRHIYELSKGDEIDVRRNGKLFTYEVTGKKIVDPDDLSVLKQSKDKRLTLITCYPTYYIGPAPQRLVVFSKLVQKPAAKVVAVSGGAKD